MSSYLIVSIHSLFDFTGKMTPNQRNWAISRVSATEFFVCLFFPILRGSMRTEQKGKRARERSHAQGQQSSSDGGGEVDRRG